jgi:predicted nucleic acid-binding protein
MEGIGVVADTSPLVAFAKLDRLDLLGLLFAEVLIPPTVERELTAKRSTESRRLQLAIGTLLQVTEPPAFVPVVRDVTLNLDAGESEAIALAFNRGLGLVVDDRLGRHAASRLRIPVVGSVGIDLEARRRGYLPLITPVFVELRRFGYWLSDDLIASAVAVAGEPRWQG